MPDPELQAYIREEIAAALAVKLAEKPVIYTVREFCKAFRLSLSYWHTLKKLGRIPRTMLLGAQTRIRKEAADEWFAREERLAESEAAKLEYERRSKLGKVVGKAAAASPKHICRATPEERAERKRKKAAAGAGGEKRGRRKGK